MSFLHMLLKEIHTIKYVSLSVEECIIVCDVRLYYQTIMYVIKIRWLLLMYNFI